MRIQTRLFLGTALLVLALTGTQWWLHRRQLAAIEREVGAVAQAVGKGVLEERVEVLVHRLEDLPLEGGTIRWFEKGGEGGDRDTSEAGPQRLFRMEQAAGAEGRRNGSNACCASIPARRSGAIRKARSAATRRRAKALSR